MKFDPRPAAIRLPFLLGIALTAACHTSGTGPGAGPAIAPGLSKVGTGEYETLYLVDGVIYGYGGGSGLLGQGSYQGTCIPPRPIDTPTGLKFVDVQGGLHQSMAIDENGHVWTWGESDKGLQGSGVDGGMGDGSVPYMITEDAGGNPFDHLVAIEPTTNFDAALKSDGTVWVWGDCTGGVTGDGTASGIVEKPTQVPLPPGVKITKISGSSQVVAVASDGTVWAWGPAETNVLGTGFTGATDGYTPRKVVDLPVDIVDVAVGYASFAYALTAAGQLYGWGYRGPYLGLGTDADEYVPTPTPIPLETVLDLPRPVVSVVADFMTTHVILDDGSLWGWGDDAQGEVGDGQELDFSKTATPYAWDFGSYELMVRKPVRIAPNVTDFVKVFANSAYDFYDYALTADGKLYSWGRNKTGTLGNGVYGLAANGNEGTSSQMEATYPNSWDVPLATLVSPFTVQAKGVNSPYCVANPTAPDC
jgi:alpha-tubulin suppressor-like RCC1 family protein